MWTCPKCGSEIEDTFDVCWSCGTSREGVVDPTFVKADDDMPIESPLDLDMPAGDEPIPTSPFGADTEVVEAYQALDIMQAKFLADQLSENGIAAVADLHDMHEALGSMSSVPRVWVRAEDLPRARAWLDEYDRNHRPQLEE